MMQFPISFASSEMLLQGLTGASSTLLAHGQEEQGCSCMAGMTWRQANPALCLWQQACSCTQCISIRCSSRLIQQAYAVKTPLPSHFPPTHAYPQLPIRMYLKQICCVIISVAVLCSLPVHNRLVTLACLTFSLPSTTCMLACVFTMHE